MSFKAGDICIYTGPVGDPVAADYIKTGDEVTLVRRDLVEGDAVWIVDIEHDDFEFCASERYLRKKRPPEQKSAFSFQELISMCNDRSITEQERQKA